MSALLELAGAIGMVIAACGLGAYIGLLEFRRQRAERRARPAVEVPWGRPPPRRYLVRVAYTRSGEPVPVINEEPA